MKDCTFDGLLSTTQGTNQNQMGATGMLCALTGQDMFQEFPKAIELFSGGVFYCQPPNAPGNECKIDDMICIVAASEWAAGETRRKLFTTLGFLQEHAPIRFERFFFRYPAFVAHVLVRLDMPLSLLMKACWTTGLSICQSLPVSQQDPWMQTGLMVLTYLDSKSKNALCDAAVSDWIRHLPKPMHEIAADYIGTEDHPLVGAWKGIKWPTPR